MELTKEAFEEWREHPVTKEIYTALEKVKVELLEKMADGITVGQSADVTHGLTNRMIGHVQGINQLLGIDFSELNNDEENTNE
jgi:hypothetical protein